MSPVFYYQSGKLTPFKEFMRQKLRDEVRPQWAKTVRGEAEYKRRLRIEYKKILEKEKAKRKDERRIAANRKKAQKARAAAVIRKEKERKKNEEFIAKQRAAAELKANEARVNAARKEFQKKTKIAELEGKKTEKLKEKERIKLLEKQIKEQRKQLEREEKKAEREERELEKLRIEALEPEVREELLSKKKQEKIDIEDAIKKRKELEEQERRFNQLYRETSLAISEAKKREDKEFQKKIKADIEIELKNLKAQIKAREKAERELRKQVLEERKAFDKLLEKEVREKVKAQRIAEKETIKDEEKERLKELRPAYKEIKEFDKLLEKEVEAKVRARRKSQIAELKEAQKIARKEGRPFAVIETKLFQAPVVLKGYKPPPELFNLANMIDKSSKKAGDKLLRESALMEWLTTPWQNLAKLPGDLVTDFKELVKGERKDPLSFSFPGWEDVFRFGPEPTLTDQEWKDYKSWNARRKNAAKLIDAGKEAEYDAAIAGIGPNPLSKESQEIIKKRAARRKKMEESPTPKTIQNIASTMMWIDDINDGLVTTAYLYKVGLRILGSAAPKVGLRFLPGLGYIMIAKDLFDIGKWVRGTGYFRSVTKRGFWEFLEQIPWVTRKKFRPFKIAHLLPSFAEAIQIAQTTEVLTGYGLRIGPVLGHTYDSIFGTLRGAEFEGLNKVFKPEEMVQELRSQRVHEKQISVVSPASTDAIRILNAAPHVLSQATDLSFEDNINVLNSCNIAATYLEKTNGLEHWTEWSKDTIDTNERAVATSNRIREEFIDEIGKDPGPDGVFPYMDGATELSPRMKSALPGNSISDSFKKVLKKVDKSDQRIALYTSLISEFPDHLFKAVEGPGLDIKTKMNTDAKSYFLLQEYGLAKKLGTPDELHQSLAETISYELIRQQRNSLSYQEVEALVEIYKRLK